MATMKILIATCLLIASVCAFGSDDRFIKKYAMMKIYESCFGQEVIKQIRKEMKDACAKCATLDGPPRLQPQAVTQPILRPTYATERPKLEEGLLDPQNSLYANAQTYDDRMQQSFLAYRPPNPFQVPYRPYSGSGASGYYPGYASSGPLYYPAGLQQSNPFAASPYAVPFMAAQPYYNSGRRMAREMDIRNQLEALTARMSNKAKNVTCVMQELGYLNENLEPNFEKIRERIGLLPIAEELRSDMQDGVDFCQQFSQCVPDVNKNKSPLSRELVRPMFFFKCYKHKKLEACIMKDVREKFTGVPDEDFDGSDVEFRRGKEMKFEDEDVDKLASSMYDFLYGTDSSMDIDSFF